MADHLRAGAIGRFDAPRSIGRSLIGRLFVVTSGAEGPLALCALDPERLDASADALFGELQWASRLEHPGLGAISEVGRAGAVVYMAGPWITGVPLAALVRGPGGRVQPVPAEVVALIGRELCAVVGAVNDAWGASAPRHVLAAPTPHTVLLTEDGHVRWSELVLVEDPQALSAPLSAFGGPVQSVGACLYLLLTGLRHLPASERSGARVPFGIGNGASLEAIVRRSLVAGAGGYGDVAALGLALHAYLETRGAALTSADVARWLQRSSRSGWTAVPPPAAPDVAPPARHLATRLYEALVGEVAKEDPPPAPADASARGRRAPTRQLALTDDAPLAEIAPEPDFASPHEADTVLFDLEHFARAQPDAGEASERVPPPVASAPATAEALPLPSVWTSLTARLLVVALAVLFAMSVLLAQLWMVRAERMDGAALSRPAAGAPAPPPSRTSAP
jgi:hypothetical protein